MTKPSPSLPVDLTRVGHLLGPHGIQGALKLYVIGDPNQLRALRRLYVEGLGWLRLQRFEQHGAGVVLTLGGITDREMAAALHGKHVYAHDQELPPLPEGEYYYHELRGLRVQDEGGAVLGEVTEVLDMGHQDVLVVRSDTGQEGLIPLQAPYVQVRRKVAIVLSAEAPQGLMSEAASSTEHDQYDGGR